MDFTDENTNVESAPASAVRFGIKRSQVQILSPRYVVSGASSNKCDDAPLFSRHDEQPLGRRGGRQTSDEPKTGLAFPKGPKTKDNWTVDPTTGCHLWTRCIDKDGYGYFRRDGKHVRAHCHYYEREHGPIPAGMEPDHTCRNRRCVNPDHIEVITKIENIRRGNVCKLTLDKAREIRRLMAGGAKKADVAAQFGIKEITVYFIVSNRLWKEQPSPASPTPHAHSRPVSQSAGGQSPVPFPRRGSPPRGVGIGESFNSLAAPAAYLSPLPGGGAALLITHQARADSSRAHPGCTCSPESTKREATRMPLNVRNDSQGSARPSEPENDIRGQLTDAADWTLLAPRVAGAPGSSSIACPSLQVRELPSSEGTGDLLLRGCRERADSAAPDGAFSRCPWCETAINPGEGIHSDDMVFCCFECAEEFYEMERGAW